MSPLDFMLNPKSILTPCFHRECDLAPGHIISFSDKGFLLTCFKHIQDASQQLDPSCQKLPSSGRVIIPFGCLKLVELDENKTDETQITIQTAKKCHHLVSQILLVMKPNDNTRQISHMSFLCNNHLSVEIGRLVQDHMGFTVIPLFKF